jgi:hypothetical protein
MREQMSDRDFLNLNQAHGKPEVSHDLALRYFEEGRELERTVASMKAEIAHLNQRLASSHKTIELLTDKVTG